MISRDECRCSCHQTGAVHFFPCCEDIAIATGMPYDPPKFSEGGLVKGPANNADENVFTLLSRGSYELPRKVVETYGDSLLDAINRGNVDLVIIDDVIPNLTPEEQKAARDAAWEWRNRD